MTIINKRTLKKAGKIITSPSYVTPILPQSEYEPNTSVATEMTEPSGDGKLASLSPVGLAWRTGAQKGNVNSSDFQYSQLPDGVVQYMKDHPKITVMRKPWEQRGSSFAELEREEPIKSDFSNLRASDAVRPAAYTWSQQREIEAPESSVIKPWPVLGKANVGTAAEAARVYGDVNRISSALRGWREFLESNPYYSSFYDYVPETESMEGKMRDDARAIKELVDAYPSDPMGALMAAVGSTSISKYGKDVLRALTGYNLGNIVDRDMDDRFKQDLFNADFNRLNNAYKAASQYYDRDDNRPSEEYDPGVMTNDENYNQWFKDQALKDFVVRGSVPKAYGGRLYSRGGRIQTRPAPNTIRAQNGLKLRKADGMCNDEYDVYL